MTTTETNTQFKTDDVRIREIKELAPPAHLLREFPASDKASRLVFETRNEIHRILHGADDRLLMICGPCSIHDVKAAKEYAGRLLELKQRLADRVLVVMRVYFEKPRTSIGWKGLINDPHLDGTGDVNAGLRVARALLLQILDTGLPIGCEFLDPITPQYISDAVAWGAIGARTTESQIHRQLGSGLSMPIGFKNRTDGDVQVAVDAVRAAAASHAFAGIDDSGIPAIHHTTGNPDGHVILRGGKGAPNYGEAGVRDALAKLRAEGLPERVVIDASHDNSGKVPARQIVAAGEIGEQISAGNKAIVGIMLESFIVEGSQSSEGEGELTYGQSITDACIAWEDTVSVLGGLAEAVRARRAR